MTARDRIIVALDVAAPHEALELARLVAPHAGMVKVGLELFMAAGPGIIKDLRLPVMLDLKLHDIPTTVARATQVAVDLGVKFLTIHAQQRETYRKVLAITRGTGTTPLVVSALSSMSDEDCRGLGGSLYHRVRMSVEDACLEGMSGFVCPPGQIRDVRGHGLAMGTSRLTLVVPGIRPEGSPKEDHDASMTPREALACGADYLVIGRPIRDADNPAKAAADILNSLPVE